jgi:ectoine hydroxylase-related dioxygenase (phytanoyl-CoA dioxygenase family)
LNFDHLEFPFALLTNIYLVDTNSENGATEIWLGTHKFGGNGLRVEEKDAPWIKSEYLEERRKLSPPIRPEIKKGSVVIRDLRLWHAGIPNRTDEPRILLNGVWHWGS